MTSISLKQTEEEEITVYPHCGVHFRTQMSFCQDNYIKNQLASAKNQMASSQPLQYFQINCFKCQTSFQ